MAWSVTNARRDGDLAGGSLDAGAAKAGTGAVRGGSGMTAGGDVAFTTNSDGRLVWYATGIYGFGASFPGGWGHGGATLDTVIKPVCK